MITFFLPLFYFSLLVLAPLGRADDSISDGLSVGQSKEEKDNFISCRNAAQRGDAQAMGLLGLMYEKGRGTTKDYGEALKWLQRGAKKGDAADQNNLGFLYLKGLGVKKDDAQALMWFQKAADQGLASAQENLGLMYGGGEGTHKDYEKAFGWFKKAAEQNDLEAQINLATLYSLGEGGPKDFVESHKWFSLALKHPSLSDNQLSDLRDDIEWLEKRMSGKSIAKAKKLAAVWEPSSR
ncbi:MAG TPA: tetratricopeptide repeat protein [bacterium]